MALLTSNRFAPIVAFPTVNQNTTKDPKSLYTYLAAQRQQLLTLVAALSSTLNGISGVGNASDMPPAGNAGRLFYTLDTQHFFVDDGTSWIQLV